MRVIDFLDIRLENCGCHSEVEISFPNGCLLGITGKNGKGKSTIYKSLMVSLFGDTGEERESLDIKDLVNRKNPKNLFIRTRWKIDGVLYEVHKYQNHSSHKNKTILLEGGKDISGKSVTETHKKIETLLCSKEIFRNTIYFSQQIKDFFTALTNTQQKKIFSAILVFEEWERRYKHTDNVLKGLKSNLEKLLVVFTEMSTKIPERETYLRRLLTYKQETINKVSKDIVDLASEISTLQTQNKSINKQIKDIKYDKEGHDKILLKIAKLEIDKEQQKEKEHNEIEKINQRFDSTIENLKLEAKTKFGEEKEKIISESQGKINEISSEVQRITENIGFLKESLNKELDEVQSEFNKKIDTKQEELLSITIDIGDKKSKCSSLQKEGKELKQDIEKLSLENELIQNQEDSTCSKCGQELHDKSKEKVLSDNNKLIAQYTNTFNDLRERNDEIKEQIELLEVESEKIKTEISVIKEELDKKEEELSSITNKEVENLESDKQKIIDERDNIQKDIESKVSIVREKVQKDYKDLISEQISNKQKCIEELQKQLEKISNDIYNNIKGYTEEEKLFSSKKNEIEELKNSLNNISNLLGIKEQTLKESQNFKYDEVEIQTCEKELNKLKESFNTVKEKKQQFEEIIPIVEFWKEAYSDRGIKSMLIDDSLPFLNQKVREELEKVAPGKFILTFDTLSENASGDVKDKFNVRILNTETGADHYRLLSGGEKRIIDVCTLTGLRKLTESLHDKKFNILLLDEVLDSLDSDNSISYLNILKKAASDLSVCLVTHNPINARFCDEIYNF